MAKIIPVQISWMRILRTEMANKRIKPYLTKKINPDSTFLTPISVSSLFNGGNLFSDPLFVSETCTVHLFQYRNLNSRATAPTVRHDTCKITPTCYSCY